MQNFLNNITIICKILLWNFQPGGCVGFESFFYMASYKVNITKLILIQRTLTTIRKEWFLTILYNLLSNCFELRQFWKLYTFETIYRISRLLLRHHRIMQLCKLYDKVVKTSRLEKNYYYNCPKRHKSRENDMIYWHLLRQ